MSSPAERAHVGSSAHLDVDWRRVARLILVSRKVDEIEETRLVPARKVLYQFSARGHDLAQILLGLQITDPHDAANGYYRSRPFLFALGLSIEDAFAGPMALSGGFSDGRDIGVVFNYPNPGGPLMMPMCGGVGAQYTPAAGWAQAIRYRHQTLGEDEYAQSIAVTLGGDASVATNGFWSALTIATTLELPMLFYIEDNGFGISVPGYMQTPGGNIAENLAAFRNLHVLDGDGTAPEEAARLIDEAVQHVRVRKGAALLRLAVPRLSGHSAQDTQAYKSEALVEQERARDPLPKLREHVVPDVLSNAEWGALEKDVERTVEEALERAMQRPLPDTGRITRYVFCERRDDGSPDLQVRGGLVPEGHEFPPTSHEANPEPQRINMLTAIRRTLAHELETNDKVVVFGEDVGPKGGVHAATLGLQEKFGEARVFDTSLSEEGIIGRAVGMAIAGLMPVPEIQFRKYADPAAEQLNDTGTMRWRTINRFAAPMVVRIPGGFFKCGDPWHSQTNEVLWAHAIGWRVAMPSNANDAVGLLRSAMRGNDPTIFFEHRAMLDSAWARRPYPGDHYVLPFGQADIVREGSDLTVVSWGALVERCVQAAEDADGDVEVIDLRTLMPWDKAAVLESVRKTRRCLIVHEDNLTAGFGAEVAAMLVDEGFFDLDAPIRRLTMPDIPSPHSPLLMNAVVPDKERIGGAMRELLET
ncbi:transketolase C-terminal domain-containing protein [soil metagenome]